MSTTLLRSSLARAMSTTRTANHAGIKISGAPRGNPVEWLNSFCPFALAKPMAPKSGSTRSLRVATASDTAQGQRSFNNTGVQRRGR